MSAFSELLDVVEHVVKTHSFWNEGLTQVAALEKVAKARTLNLMDDVKADVGDARAVLTEEEQLAQDARDKALADAQQLIADAEGKDNGGK